MKAERPEGLTCAAGCCAAVLTTFLTCSARAQGEGSSDACPFILVPPRQPFGFSLNNVPLYPRSLKLSSILLLRQIEKKITQHFV